MRSSCFLFLLLLPFCLSQNCIHQLTQAQRDAILKIHNDYRNKVAQGVQQAANGVTLPQAANMRELVWDSELETLAQTWANTNPKSHNPNRSVPSDPSDYIGENMYWASKGTSKVLVPGNFNYSAGVASWFNEVASYDGNVNDFGSQTTSQVVGHFTQVVWAETARLGCGVLDCVSTTTSNGFNMYMESALLVCDYRTGGNWLNSAVYNPGQSCSQCPGICSTSYGALCA